MSEFEEGSKQERLLVIKNVMPSDFFCGTTAVAMTSWLTTHIVANELVALLSATRFRAIEWVSSVHFSKSV